LKAKDNKTEICNINGLLGTSGIVSCIGIITSGEDNMIYLEDETMKVKLDLSTAESDGESYFIEGNIVFC